MIRGHVWFLIWDHVPMEIMGTAIMGTMDSVPRMIMVLAPIMILALARIVIRVCV